MSRRPRLTYPAATRHVMGRANGKQKLFLDQDDRFAFLNMLSVARDVYDVEWKLFAGLGHDLYRRNQMVLRAQVVHGSTQAEIARALALHPSTISKITRRIRQQHYFIVRLK